jgi:hypothetical protein
MNDMTTQVNLMPNHLKLPFKRLHQPFIENPYQASFPPASLSVLNQQWQFTASTHRISRRFYEI